MKKEQYFVVLLILLTVFFSPKDVFAMHIMEGFLPQVWCVFWAVLSAPIIIFAFYKVKKSIACEPKFFILLALCAAFAFTLSALKLPSITGSSSHPTGVGLSAILFGPLASAVISVIILLFQAVLLAHGGITTLGANVFSMGIAGPIFAFLVYKLMKKSNVELAVFFAAFVGNISTYVVTSLQLGLAFPQDGNVLVSFLKFLGVFLLSQVPLAITEGLLTVVIFNVVKKYRREDLIALDVLNRGALDPNDSK